MMFSDETKEVEEIKNGPVIHSRFSEIYGSGKTSEFSSPVKNRQFF